MDKQTDNPILRYPQARGIEIHVLSLSKEIVYIVCYRIFALNWYFQHNISKYHTFMRYSNKANIASYILRGSSMALINFIIKHHVRFLSPRFISLQLLEV